MFGLKRILGGTSSPTRVMVMVAGLLCAAVLAGCGQKGPLYLPDPNAPPPKKTRATQTIPAETPPAPPPAQR